MAQRGFRDTVLVCCSAALLALFGGAAAAQEGALAGSALESSPQEEDHPGTETRQPGPRPQSVVPLTSSFLLNGVTLDYGAKGFLSAGALDGAHRSLSADFNATYALVSNLDQGIQGALFHRRQFGWYLQLQSTDRRRTITTLQDEAVDLLGVRLQLSITGGCIFPDADPGALCTYTPGLEVDPNSIDPDTLVPGRFITNSSFGQTISAETHDALTAPGFQRGVRGGEMIGLDLDFPNTGYTPSRDRSGANGVGRIEEVEQRSIPILSRVEQNLYSSSTRASLDRTIRSFALLEEREWTWTALALQAAAWLLPAFDARLPAGLGSPNPHISNNLFLSANNVRLPPDSITSYQSSTSWVTHADAPAQRASETPVAWSNSVWLGFSRVRNIVSTSREMLRPTSPRTNRTSVFAQGGLDVPWDGLIDGRITIIDEIDDQITAIDFSDIDDLFVQTGTEITTQEAIRRVISQEVSDYYYVPHLSLSGNRTSGVSVLRYYMGVMIPDDANAYVGADYALNTEDGWSAYARADFYSNPDQDYYSEVEGRLSRRIGISSERSLTFGIAAHAALDRPNLDGSTPRLGEGSNGIEVVAGYQGAPVDLTLRQRFSDIATDSSSSSTTIGITYRVNPHLTLTAEHTPYSTEDSYIKTRAGLTWSLGDGLNAPDLRMQWARTGYDYGQDVTGRRMEMSEDVFLAAIQVRF